MPANSIGVRLGAGFRFGLSLSSEFPAVVMFLNGEGG